MNKNNFLYIALLVQTINSILYGLDKYKNTIYFLLIFIITVLVTIFFERIPINRKTYTLVGTIMISVYIFIIAINNWEVNITVLSYMAVFLQLSLTFRSNLLDR